jgi:hypothetical protein
MYLVDQPHHSSFTAPELARLAAYRAAVAAGFYTDWDGSAATTDTEELAWLSGANHPFTADERQRLDRLRLNLSEGRYADDQPAPPPPAPGTPTRGATDATGDESAA